MYQCKCGLEFQDPIRAIECELSGHRAVLEPAPDSTADIKIVLSNLDNAALVAAVRAITHRDRIPFRDLLNELARRLEILDRFAQNP